MILGIGTDILNMHLLEDCSLAPSDPFLRRTYTEEEQREAAAREDSRAYYATRFAAKEALFKALYAAADPRRGEAPKRGTEMEVLTLENGAPCVRLSGDAKERARSMGVTKIHLSLSYDTPYAVAFAVLEGTAETN